MSHYIAVTVTYTAKLEARVATIASIAFSLAWTRCYQGLLLLIPHIDHNASDRYNTNAVRMTS